MIGPTASITSVRKRWLLQECIETLLKSEAQRPQLGKLEPLEEVVVFPSLEEVVVFSSLEEAVVFSSLEEVVVSLLLPRKLRRVMYIVQ